MQKQKNIYIYIYEEQEQCEICSLNSLNPRLRKFWRACLLLSEQYASNENRQATACDRALDFAEFAAFTSTCQCKEVPKLSEDVGGIQPQSRLVYQNTLHAQTLQGIHTNLSSRSGSLRSTPLLPFPPSPPSLSYPQLATCHPANREGSCAYLAFNQFRTEEALEMQSILALLALELMSH